MTEKRLYEIPESWEWTRLGDVFKTTSGGTPKRKNKDYYDGNIPWIKSGELNNNIITFAEEHITEEALENSSAKIFPQGTLLIAMYGATVGKLGILGIDASTNQAICAIFTPSEIDQKFIYWYLINYRDELLNSRIGGAQPNISQTIIRNIQLPVPPYAEQKRIVSKIEELFTKLDTGINELKQVKEQLKIYRQSVLKYAFEGKLTKKWRESHINELEDIIDIQKIIKEKQRNNRLKKYKDLPPIESYELPKMPDSWISVRIWEISNKIQYGTSEKANGDYSDVPVLRMGNIQDSQLIFNDLKYMSKEWDKLDDFLLNDGDVLFNRTNSAELVGKTAVYKSGHPKSVFASYLIRVNVNRKLYIPDFLSFFINSHYGRLYISSVVSQQVGQANVNGTKLSLMPVPLPTIAEQEIIIKIIEKKFSNLYQIEKITINSLEQAERLRQSVLKKAFKGKLVPQNPADGPAEKILEKIKAEKDKQKPKKRMKAREKTIKQARLV